jgi:hypothetical protein
LAQVHGGFPHPFQLFLRLRQGLCMGVHHEALAGLQLVHPLAQRVGLVGFSAYHHHLGVQHLDLCPQVVRPLALPVPPLLGTVSTGVRRIQLLAQCRDRVLQRRQGLRMEW